MGARRHLTHLDPDYPSRLRGVAFAPASIALSGGPLEAHRTVAVVGSRCATPQAIAFTGELCRSLVRAGAVIVSGGARGVDSTAHRATLEAGGTTWLVAAKAPDQRSDREKWLFDAVGAGPGAIVWTSEDDVVHRSAFLRRNRILVALSDAVAVIQAGKPSGALHAARWARKLGRPLWVVPELPWSEPFAGCRRLLEEGATPLVSIGRMLKSLGTNPTLRKRLFERQSSHDPTSPPGPGSAELLIDPIYRFKTIIWEAMSNAPQHMDSLSAHARCSAQATAAALLTLALENVVVEGPPGFFRRRDC